MIGYLITFKFKFCNQFANESSFRNRSTLNDGNFGDVDNNFRLQKFSNDHYESKLCDFFGWTREESIIIFHSCSTTFYLKTNSTGFCYEKHIGHTPRSIMTKGRVAGFRNMVPLGVMSHNLCGRVV